MSSAGMGYMGLGGYMPKPLAAKLAEGEMLLAKDINTLFIDDDGKPLDRRQIPWNHAPESIGALKRLPGSSESYNIIIPSESITTRCFSASLPVTHLQLSTCWERFSHLQ
ncbi:hypothetical protein LB505_004999 [Fusarium chuoi]|nr:hypothetical protein LB505_004999 [Fusarium chuoi]